MSHTRQRKLPNISMSRVTGAIQSCHTYACVISRTRQWLGIYVYIYICIYICITDTDRHINESCHRFHWVMSHTWVRHVTHTTVTGLPPTPTVISMSYVIGTIELCHTYHWVTSHISMSHITHIHESHYIIQWVTSHMSMSRVAQTIELCHRYQWITSHISMSHVTHINETY